jgi:hypothetical protein
LFFPDTPLETGKITIVNQPYHFTLFAAAPRSKARADTFTIPHCAIETPVFMPDGTQATMKSLSPAKLDACGSSIVKRHGAIHQLTISTTLSIGGHRRRQSSPRLQPSLKLRLTSSVFFSFPFHSFLLKMFFLLI